VPNAAVSHIAGVTALADNFERQSPGRPGFGVSEGQGQRNRGAAKPADEIAHCVPAQTVIGGVGDCSHGIADFRRRGMHQWL
jgi:hypothetical protein